MTIWMNMFKRKIKDYKLLFMISLFPMLLTIIFVGMFTTVEELDEEISFILAIDGETASTREEELIGYFKAAGESMNISIADEEDERIDFVIHVNSDTLNMEIENRGGNTIEEVILYTLLEQFNSQYALGEVVGSYIAEPFRLEVENMEGNKDNDITVPLVVTMLIFGILLGGNYGIKQVFYMGQAVGTRALTAPISKRRLYFIEFMTSTLMIWVISCIGAGVYEALFKVRFSNNILLTLVMIFIMSMLATLLGMSIGINIRTQDMGENILSLIITFSAILSGSLMPMIELGKITALSPIKHLADTFNEIIMAGRIVNIVPLGITLGICFAVLIVLSIFGLRRRRGI